MLFVLIGAAATAVLAACVAFIVTRATGVSHRWLIPASAGAAMLGFTLWNDYSWFDRQRAGLPEGVVVVETFEHSAAIQPWTLVAPVVNRFMALDLRAARRDRAAPGVVSAPLFIAQRYQPTFVTLQVIDCPGARRADLPADAAFGVDGLPVGVDWRAMAPDHPLIRAACGAAG